MIRLSGLFFIFIAIFCAVLLFQTSQSVQRLENELANIEQKNQKERDEIRVLSTEWDYLNSPDRLEGLLKNKIVSSSVNTVTDAKKIPEPAVPALPKPKPVFIHYQKEAINGSP